MEQNETERGLPDEEQDEEQSGLQLKMELEAEVKSRGMSGEKTK